MNLAKRDDVYKLQAMMLEEEQIGLHVEHYFSDGCYARELHIPAGVCLVGATHKTNHHFVISKGECLIVCDEHRKELAAPYHGQTLAGDKRVIYAITDTIFTTFHVTNETDIDKIEEQLLQVEL